MESAETLANLQKFLELLNPSLNLNDMLTAVATQLVEMFEVDHSGMLLFSEHDQSGSVIAEYPAHGAVGLNVPLTDYPLLEQLRVEKKPIAILSAQTDPLMGQAQSVMRQLGIQSILIIPLVVRNRILGSLSLDAIKRPRQFSKQELELSGIIGNQIAVAVDYTFSLAAVESSRQQAQTLREVNRALSQLLDLDEVLQLILEQLEKVLPVGGSSIYLRVADGIQLKAWRGRRKPMADYAHIPLNKLWGASELFHQKQALLIPKTREHPNWTISSDSAIESWLGVPLVVRGKVVGVLNVDGYVADQFNERHISIATDFAHQAAIAIHNAELYGEAVGRAELLRSIQEVGVRIVSSLDLDHVLQAVSTSILETLNAQYIRICMYNRQRESFKLAYALDGRAESAGNVTPGESRFPRKNGLTATVARSGKSMVISNARQHRLFREQGDYPRFGAIAGVPLKRRNEVLGVVSVSYDDPHHFTAHELDALELLALQAAVALENARLFSLEVKQVEQELSIARQIQQGFLPQEIPHIPGWDLTAVCLPARETGGDFYEFVGRRDNYWGLAIGDVSGKSIQAAMLMGAAQSLVAAKGSDHFSPARVMAETNQLLFEDVPHGAFVALCYALVSPESNKLVFSNGGQLAPYLVPSNQQPVRLIETPGFHFPLGIFPTVTYDEFSLSLQPGDMMVFFTDGLIERMNPERQLFGFEEVAGVLETLRGQSAQRVLQALLRAANQFARGEHAHDDVTILVIRRLE
jgi:serine phosphatase RsbU (regulator of sigma subunit)/putative methionine-R-sulfoxide reductase with GAF domain